MIDTTVILSAIGDVREDVGALRSDGRNREKQLDNIEKLIAAHIEADNKVAARVTSLEHDRTKVRAILGVLGALASLGVANGVVAIAKGWFPHV